MVTDPFLEEEKWKHQDSFASMGGGWAALLAGFVIPSTLSVPKDARHWLQGYWEGNLFKGIQMIRELVMIFVGCLFFKHRAVPLLDFLRRKTELSCKCFPITKNCEYRKQHINAHQQGQDLYVNVHLWNPPWGCEHPPCAPAGRTAARGGWAAGLGNLD